MTGGRRPLKSRDTHWARAISGWLVHRRVSPNSISVFGMIFATIGSAAFVFASLHTPGRAWLLVTAVLGIQLRLLCNLLDGMVAVEGGLKGKAGDLFNEAPDRYADVVLLVGAAYAAGTPWLGWIAATFAVSTAYVRALGASCGQGQDFCGPMAKQHRMFCLTLGSIAAIFHLPALYWTLVIIAAGAALTALRRVIRLYHKMP